MKARPLKWLEVLAQNGHSLARWKADQAPLKAFSIHFYQFKLITPNDANFTSIRLQPTSQQVVAATLQSLLRIY